MNKNLNSNLAFVDLLFNLILGFAFLFIVSFILINDPTKKAGVEQKAEYMIILSWDDQLDVDMDLWVEGPSGIVGFRSPQRGFMNLDRDDLGHKTDSVTTQNQESIVYINREVVNIRGFQKGEYIVNAHYYYTKSRSMPVDVSIEVVKLNPYDPIYQGSKRFTYKGQEETFMRFTMNSDGTFQEINHLPKNIVNQQQNW